MKTKIFIHLYFVDRNVPQNFEKEQVKKDYNGTLFYLNLNTVYYYDK